MPRHHYKIGFRKRHNIRIVASDIRFITTKSEQIKDWVNVVLTGKG
ncbi:MAG TPA: hypothetical protein VHZ55_12055 [Bryobacteraceae bacterium]|nr:hypothetical protein [Bryobacteraceae bacterium]